MEREEKASRYARGQGEKCFEHLTVQLAKTGQGERGWKDDTWKGKRNEMSLPEVKERML